MPGFVWCLLLLRLPAIKVVENRLLFLVRDTWPVVYHPEPCFPFLTLIDPQLNRTPLRGIGMRIIQQDGEYLLQALLIRKTDGSAVSGSCKVSSCAFCAKMGTNFS